MQRFISVPLGLALCFAATAAAYAVSLPCDHQVVLLKGSAKERGVQFGKKCGESIAALIGLKRVQFAREWGEWEAMAEGAKPAIAQWLPEYLEELEGIVEGTRGAVSMADLLMMATEYEAELRFGAFDSAKQCTGFSSVQSQYSMFITGQNNDETPNQWAGGRHDLVVHAFNLEPVSASAPTQLLMYTHPGVPAYMGLNDHQLSVLWFYVDSGDRNYSGMPTTVLIRALLERCSNLADARALFESVDVSLPNSFLISSGSENKSMVLEISPDYGVEYMELAHGTSFLSHANSVLINSAMWDNEIRPKDADPSHKSVDRYRVITQALLDSSDEKRTVALCEERVLSADPVLNVHTMASMLFEPQLGTMHIRFRPLNGTQSAWHTASLER